MKLNIGCGQTIIKGWVNADNSFSIRMSKFPLFFSKLFFKIKILNKSQYDFIIFARKNNIENIDATKLPYNSSSIDVIYSSHMMEHLQRNDAITFLKECFRVLKPEGILRLSLPDLKIFVDNYLKHNDADLFIEHLLMEPPKTKKIKHLIKLFISGGFREHSWMYDGKSLLKLLKEFGFKNSIILKPGDTNIPNEKNLNLYERAEESTYVEGFKN
jgi:predicted SAM-dependent methyltransferase